MGCQVSLFDATLARLPFKGAKKPQLQQMCRISSLPDTGKIADMLARLEHEIYIRIEAC
jgi:hypothetical protein